jgi:hypothetical protein
LYFVTTSLPKSLKKGGDLGSFSQMEPFSKLKKAFDFFEALNPLSSSNATHGTGSLAVRVYRVTAGAFALVV